MSGNKFVGEGLSLYTFYMPKYVGVDEEGKAVWDKNILDDKGNIIGRETTTTYSEASDYLCGSAIPDLYGGFGTSIDFFGFDFGVNFTYQIGGLTYDGGYASMMGSPRSGTTGTNIHRDIMKAWSSDNTSSDIPRWRYNDQYQNAESDRWLTDASYLNIQNLQLGYTIPAKLTKKFGVSRLRIYLACDNVWYWSKRDGLDPRQSFTGATGLAYYAPVRTVSGGINIQF